MATRATRRRRLLIVGSLVVAVSASACAGDDADPSSEPTTAPTTAQGPSADEELDVEFAVFRYTGAFLSGDGATAHALLSERCQERLSVPEMEEIAGAAANRYEGVSNYDDITVDTFDGQSARVTYRFEGAPELDQEREPWVLEGGDWRNDEC